METAAPRIPLLPNRLRPLGYAAFGLGLAGAVARFGFSWNPAFLTGKAFALVSVYFQPRYFAVIGNDYTNELIGVLLLCGLAGIALTKEKSETPGLAALRLRAFVVAAIVNTTLLAASFFLIFGFAFVGVLVANLFSSLIIYLVVFQWSRLRAGRRVTSGERTDVRASAQRQARDD